MSKAMYLSAMRNASGLLFFVAIINPILAVATVFIGYAATSPEAGPLAGGVSLTTLQVVNGFYQATSASVWPLAAAAALWRWDSVLRGKAVAE